MKMIEVEAIAVRVAVAVPAARVHLILMMKWRLWMEIHLSIFVAPYVSVFYLC